MFRKLFGLARSDEKKTGANHYDIDTDCNYCPNCGEAYRAEIATCADCSIALMSGAEKAEAKDKVEQLAAQME